MGEKESGTGFLLILSDDDDDDEAQNNTVLPDSSSQPDKDMSIYGIDIKEDSDDINSSSNVADDVEAAEKIPPISPDTRQSDEVTSLTFGIDIKDDRKVEKPDPVYNIFASKNSMLSMDSNPDSITGQLNIGTILASKLDSKECKGGGEGKWDIPRKRSNSKEKEKIRDEQFPIVKVEETSNDNKNKLREGTDYDEADKIDASQFHIVKEQSTDNKDTLIEGTGSNEKETIDDSQHDTDPATLSVKEKLSLLQISPPEPKKRDKPTVVPRSSIKNRSSLFEAQPPTGNEQKPVPAPRRRTKQESVSSIRRTQSLLEHSTLKGEIGSKPGRNSMFEQTHSFKAALEKAERSSIGIPAISSEHGTSEIGSKPERKSVIQPGRSFKAAREKAERSFIGIQAISSEHAVPGVRDSTVLDGTHTHIQSTKIAYKTQKDNTMVVAAIDFGTTFSAVAFSFTNAPEAIYAKIWDGKVKVPTVILLDPDKKVHSFGDEAKHAFGEKYDNQDNYKKWFYFDCFKMDLYVKNQYLDKNFKLKDFSGKEMAAMDVFEKAISYLRGELLTLLNEKRRGVVINSTTDIHWVLTVPAIWPDLSKTFMREAAEKAGIPTDYLTLALEPEAASLFCRRMLGVELRGQKFIIMDLGGGTADLVCHEVQHDDSIKECHMATGGNFGGKMVNDKFMERLISHYGAEIVKKFRKTKQYLELIEAFETKKNTFDGTGDFVHFTFPHTLNDIYQREIGEPIETTIQQSPRQGKLFWERGKIGISMDIMQAMFDEPLKHIIKTTRRIIESVQNVNHIIMVGGFSNSKYITQCIQQSFPEEGFVLTIDSPEVAVVKGAVIFGHENKAITTRISKYTYGIGRLMKFKPGDREDYKIYANGTAWCDNCFNKHIEIGEEMHCDDDVIAHEYFPPSKDATNFIIEVIASNKSDPKYTTDEGCYPVGILRLEMDTKGDVWSKVEVKLVSKGTELEIQALDVNSGKLTTGKAQFWS